MRNHDERGLVEAVSNAELNETIRSHVHGRRGLVEHQKPGTRQDGPREANKLSLAVGQIAAAFGHFARQTLEYVDVVLRRRGRQLIVGIAAAASVAVRVDQVHTRETAVKLLIAVLIGWVQVAANSAGKQNRVLLREELVSERGSVLVQIYNSAIRLPEE